VSHQPTHKLSDRQVVNLILSGDMRTFSSLIEMTESLVAHIVYKLIPNEEDRKDTAQDVYLKVYRHLNGFKFQSKLSTWVGQIAYNTCLNRLGKKQLPVYWPLERDTDGPDDDSWPDTYRATDETDRVLLQKELKGLLQAQIRRLPTLYQTLIGLYHQEELSYLEIARITGLPEGTVKSYLFRARQQLKETILSIYKREKL
jgi:RNA polymerase sigma-70 factor (ECF subfamily)